MAGDGSGVAGSPVTGARRWIEFNVLETCRLHLRDRRPRDRCLRFERFEGLEIDCSLPRGRTARANQSDDEREMQRREHRVLDACGSANAVLRNRNVKSGSIPPPGKAGPSRIAVFSHCGLSGSDS